MYLTAHEVEDAQGARGINVFLHLHGQNFVWPTLPVRIPEENPGPISHRAIEIPPGGNKVHAYLDIIAPDGTTFEEVEAVLDEFQRGLGIVDLPAALVRIAIAVRFGLPRGAEDQAKPHFQSLRTEALSHARRWLSVSVSSIER